MSTGEIIMILFVYLLFFGAKGIPSLAQTLGKAMYQFRNATKDVQEEILKGASEVKKQTSALRLDQIDAAESPKSNPVSTQPFENKPLTDEKSEGI